MKRAYNVCSHFDQGLVDSNDLPLNVNREDLQKNKVMGLISRKLTRKILDMLRDLARGGDGTGGGEDDEDTETSEKKAETQSKEQKSDEKYLKFWNEFGKALKLGVLEDHRNKKRIIELLRFVSTRSPTTPISLRSYVDHMKPGQKFIYFIAAGGVDEAENSPFLERFRNKGYEVLYFTDNLDEFMNLQEYDDIPFQAITKENVELDGKKMKEFLKQKEEEFAELKTWLKEAYGSKISKVQISSTLEATPMAIATATYGTSARMEKIGKAQAMGNQMYPMRATKVLQINYRHPVIIEMKNRVHDSDATDELKDLARLLLDMALVKSGFEIEPDDKPNLAKEFPELFKKD
ncbi:hypothetical protein RFI_22044 [Reticulomyxa filosa]|uniref:Heat shock protein 90 n=1 Tax=Reticulomyxa filosa TaxID=46433 RepID=X6MMT6_RETFI|nr:hypothetical protein RFI_22044 [Reticulomyxa filosa]|eukprot:ETO15318.1 hypothetical protein RFI_22044 [Reticulomyxa filosa]